MLIWWRLLWRLTFYRCHSVKDLMTIWASIDTWLQGHIVLGIWPVHQPSGGRWEGNQRTVGCHTRRQYVWDPAGVPGTRGHLCHVLGLVRPLEAAVGATGVGDVRPVGVAPVPDPRTRARFYRRAGAVHAYSHGAFHERRDQHFVFTGNVNKWVLLQIYSFYIVRLLDSNLTKLVQNLHTAAVKCIKFVRIITTDTFKNCDGHR
jgi:hypothetical protein